MTDQNNNTLMDNLELDPADGQPYVWELQERLFDLLAPAQTIDEIERRLRKLYPESKVIDLAIADANKHRSEPSHKNHKTHSSSASFTGAIHNITSLAAKVSNLVRDVGNKNENELSKYKIALIQYIITDVINLAADFVGRQKPNGLITRSDIRTAMHADKDHLDMFLSDDKILVITENHPILANVICAEKAGRQDSIERLSTYKQKVRSMVDSENSFIRDLKLIIKVFKARLERLPGVEDHVRIIFCDINELLELSYLLLNALEDALESVGQEDEIPYVGTEILDLAQAEEFQAYFTFAYKRLSRKESWRDAYNEIVEDANTMTLIRSAGRPEQRFDLAFHHLLPNYLLNTIVQFFEYFRNISDLYELSKENSNREDGLALKETISILIKTKRAIEELLETEMNREDVKPLDQAQAELIKSMLEKELDAELQKERDLPLKYMPPPTIYRFSEPDSRENIEFEDSHNRTISCKDLDKYIRNQSDEIVIPEIKSATLIKLVERLTYHKQYQRNIVDSFLTTYRSFTNNSEELLDLLIERFKIPDPPLDVVYPDFRGTLDELPELRRTAFKQEIRRFRQEYSKPVKMRVINVLKSWVKNHYYDFESQPKLLDKLNSFLDEVYNNEKVLRGLIVPIKSAIDHKRIRRGEVMLSDKPPPILWFTAKEHEPERFDILTLHPVEFARQLTLIEFNLFRAIKPAELINAEELSRGSRKERRDDCSPNLSRLTRHFTLFSYWIRKCIVEAEDFDKRAAIYNRAIEIMAVLHELNNHTGLLSIGSAIESAPIKRLSHTIQTISKTTKKVLEEYNALTAGHQKNLDLELKRCNPPCIPYLGSYQTKLIHAKEGNRTFIDGIDNITTTSPTLSTDEFNSSFSNSPATPISPRTPRPTFTHISSPNPPPSATSTLQNQFFGGPPAPKKINFKMQRLRAGLVAEITNYQNPPYCLNEQPAIRNYIESIEPMMVQFAIGLDPKDGDENYWIEPTVTALTKRLDDYLFTQSEEIEPKNSKPPKSRSKLPDSWKSPGIRI